MKFILITLFAIVAAVENESQILDKFAIGNNQFTSEVYRESLKSNKGNFLICPLSTEIIFALIHSGAAGKTAQEISTTLHLPEDKEKIQQSIKELNPLLKENKSYKINSANKIYVQDGYKIKDQFKDIAVNVFNSDIQNIQFGNQKEAASEMNKWVEEKTENKIKDIINPNDLKNDTRAVLINTMYFRANWAKPFEKLSTNKKPFYLNQKDKIEVDMMDQRSHFQYYENAALKVQFLELSYKGTDVTMTFVLPNDKEGLSALEEHINDVFVRPSYEDRMVTVTIPKFKFESKINFKEILSNLGIQEAFGDYADFKEIVADEKLKIDQVFQKTFIEVDEDGTTAAAATHVRLPQLGVAPINPAQFIADHPFMFYIKIKDIVIFAGRYTSPTQ